MRTVLTGSFTIDHLRTSPFAGREIIVDGRNRTEPIKILELLDDPPPKPKVGWRYQRPRRKGNLVKEDAVRAGSREEVRWLPPPPSGPRVSAAAAAAAAADNATYARAQEQGSRQGLSAARYPAALMAQQVPPGDGVTSMALVPPQPYAASNEPRDAAYMARVEEPCADVGGWGVQYGSAYAPGYRPYRQERLPGLAPFTRVPSYASNSSREPQMEAAGTARASAWDSVRPMTASATMAAANTTTMTMAQSDSGPNAPPLATEDCFCKVHLLSLKHAATPRDVEQWVRSRMGDWARTIVGVDVPIDHHKGRIRGSAFVTLTSAAAAGKAVDALQRKLFMGRLVYARLAGEGERGSAREAATEQGQQDRGPHRPTPSAHRHHAPKGKGKGSSSSSSTRKDSAGSTGEAKYAPPVIAHGTNYRPPR